MTMLRRLLKLIRYERGVCRYCECEVEPIETICSDCWANNSAW